MRILFLTPTLPYPPIGGERLRPFYFLKYLSLYHKINLVSFGDSRIQPEMLDIYRSDSIEIDFVLLPKSRSYLNCARGIFSTLPLEVYYYSSQKMQRLINEKIGTNKFDLIFCHLIRMAHFVKDIPIKKVLDVSDALSWRYKQSYRLRSGLFRWIEFLEYKRLDVYEREAIGNFDLSLIASSKDKEYFERQIRTQGLFILPNGVEIEETVPAYQKTNPYKIVFFANMRAFPNRDAFDYFYKQIFPLIRQRVKEARFIVVGSNIPASVLSLGKADKAIEVHPDVRQINPFVQDACVSVAPMRVAVGVQNKILQSMALRVPVVTTTVGLGGIEAQPERDIFLADTPERFAEKVVMLMQNTQIKQVAIENAYRLVKNRYQWQDIVERLNEQCLRLIS